MIKLNFDPKKETPLVITYLTMRRLIGFLGVSLPFVLIIGSTLIGGCSQVLGSISAYYHSNMRDLFVGILCAVAFFLFSHGGYEIMDYITVKLASIFALGVAFFPVSADSMTGRCIVQSVNDNKMISAIHLICAALFFISLSYISMFQFTKTRKNKKKITEQKFKRNIIYRVCGAVMIICILLITVYELFLNGTEIEKFDPVFWLETLALVSFGFSWIVKGEFILYDK
jgi:hypothetical protein